MNADDAEHRVGEDVEGDQQPVVPLYHRAGRRPACRDERCDLVGERARPKPLGMRGGSRRIERRRSPRRAMPSANASAVGSLDQHAGLAVTTVSSAPPRAERDDRPAARLRLERDDAEVFFAGQQRRPPRGDTARESLRRAPAEELDVGARRRARARPRSGPSPTILSGTPG